MREPIEKENVDVPEFCRYCPRIREWEGCSFGCEALKRWEVRTKK